MAMKEWDKFVFKAPDLEIYSLSKNMEQIRGKIEVKKVSHTLVKKEKDIF
jgi:hypothetical protein